MRQLAKSWIPHSAKSPSTYQVSRLALCGNVHTNPGPARKTMPPKFSCKECGKAVRNNQDAILCSQCSCWSHDKCLQMWRGIFHYYLSNPEIDCICSLCSLPQPGAEDFMDAPGPCISDTAPSIVNGNEISMNNMPRTRTRYPGTWLMLVNTTSLI